MIDQTIVPYEPKDTVQDGTLERYTGPVYHLHYPAGCDSTLEVVVWSTLGYQSHGTNVIGKSCDVMVTGRIPTWLLERLSERGVTHEVSQVKDKLLIRPKQTKKPF
ncbi:hypothetical protein HY637_03065 [Candidatus Woesearchaeota archaeon]|nr:hypothetical protein [Candidatus Woesearchaeota archaeon]